MAISISLVAVSPHMASIVHSSTVIIVVGIHVPVAVAMIRTGEVQGVGVHWSVLAGVAVIPFTTFAVIVTVQARVVPVPRVTL